MLMPDTSSALRVIVADDDAVTRALLTDQLTSDGHEVVAQATTGGEAVTRAIALTPDVVLLDLHMPGGLGTDAAALIARMQPAPGVVLLTGDVDLAHASAEDVASAPVFAVLAKPASRALLTATVRLAAARAKELSAARTEAATARRQLEERKLIERAKGILMRRTGTSEQEAYRILQRSSQDKATPMIVLAQAVLDSEPGARQ